jgi:hypothetical protein
VNDLLDGLFFAGGGCLHAHLGICSWAQRRLSDHEDLRRRLFAIPNEILMRDSGVEVRLLRARYYLPWVRISLGDVQLDSLSRIALTLARVTGLVTPIALLAFFVASFVQAA